MMNLGLAILLSAIFLGSIWLYYITRDRWNWEKIWIRLFKYIGLPLIALLLVYGVIQLVKYIEWKNSENKHPKENLRVGITEDVKPFKVETFSDVSLGTDKNDVIFFRGAPTRKLNDILWLYEWGKKEDKRQGGYLSLNYWVKNYLYFNKDRIIAVLKFYDGWVYDAELMNESWYKSNSKRIEEKLGQPVKTIHYNGEQNRIYIYPQYNCVFFLKSNSVYAYGIYDPDHQEFLNNEFVKY